MTRVNFKSETAPSVGNNAFADGYANIQVWIPKFDNYTSYRDVLNNGDKGFVDRCEDDYGNGATMHCEDYSILNQSNGTYDHDLARFYDGKWRKVVFANLYRTGKVSLGTAHLNNIFGGWLQVMGTLDEDHLVPQGWFHKNYYEIMEGYKYQIETRTGTLGGGGLASWMNREIIGVRTIYARDIDEVYVRKYNTGGNGDFWTIESNGKNFYGSDTTVSYYDITVGDYGFDLLAQST